MRFMIDPGHGGTDSGAVGPTGLRECDVALRLAKFVRLGLLESGFEVASTRDTDDFVSLEDRCVLAASQRADFFLSLHCNAFSLESHGYEVWTSRGQTDADQIAEELFRSIGEAFPSLTPRADMTDGDSDKESGFVVLVQTPMPAVLVETAFISNMIEERWLSDPGWLMRMAGALVTGLRRRF